ncbi:MAG TPA: ATP synthase F1 subunit delta [Bryobacteraceae bacterium]|nr:ATP synthase F1 subunit delta [Bryobacteraceae bacterium]
MPQAVASRYANALVDAVLAASPKADPHQASAELSFFEEMVQGASELRNILLSPAVSATRKRSVIARFSQSMPLSTLVRNFLWVLVDHRRIAILGEIKEAFDLILDERLGLVRAQVKSAKTLEEPQKAALQAELSRLTGKQVRCDYSVEPELLGGMTARIGSTIYDGSVRAQLDYLHQRLTAH